MAFKVISRDYETLEGMNKGDDGPRQACISTATAVAYSESSGSQQFMLLPAQLQDMLWKTESHGT